MCDFQIQQLNNALDALSENKRSAIAWILTNYDEAVSICQEKPLTNLQREQLTKTAICKNDMFLLALILFEGILNT